MLADLLLAVEASAPVRFIVTTPLVYPAISAFHIIGIAVTLGSIVPVDLRLLGVLGPRFDAVLGALVRNALIGFSIAATTGLLLASVRVANYAENPAFMLKLVVLLAAGLNALLLRLVSRTRSVSEIVGRRGGRIAAGASLSLWMAAVFSGRWIAFM